MKKIKLFVNGDSHTALVYPYSQRHLPTATQILANKLSLDYENLALPGASNQRIIRTTIQRLSELDPANTIIIIGWTSFERTEWFYNNNWHNISGGPEYKVDPLVQPLRSQHITAYEENRQNDRFRATQEQHLAIWNFHKILTTLKYKFCFYQGCHTYFFGDCSQWRENFELPWETGVWVHEPYVKFQNNQHIEESFSHIVEKQGFNCADDRWHYGQDAHEYWADYLYPKVSTLVNQLL